jgi:hypothetical protein
VTINPHTQQCPQCESWYLSGLLEGQRQMEATREQAADDAARRFLSLQLLDVQIRRENKHSQDYIDVLRARRSDAA